MKSLQRGLPYALVILMSVIIMSLQIKDHFFITGIDAYFHMSDAYETARQIATGHYSYFLSIFGFNRSARIVNALYGPAWGYFSGLLLLVARNWINWEILISLVTLIIAGISMYQLVRYWQVRPLIRILISFLYMFSFEIASMINGQQYDGLGAAFIPWVLLFGSKIMNQDRFRPWTLALLMTVLAETHLMTVVISTLALLPVVIITLVVRSSRWHLTKELSLSVIITLVLTFNVWGSILEIFGSNRSRLVPTYSTPDITASQWDIVKFNQVAKLPSQNLTLLGLSTTVLMAIITLLYFLNIKRLGWPLHMIMLVWGLGFLWLSTKWFPWASVQKCSEYFHTVLQFPKRFLPISIAALYLMLGIVISRYSFHQVPVIFSGLTVILVLFIIHNGINNYRQMNFERATYFSSQVTNLRLIRLTWLQRPSAKRLKNSLASNHPGRYFDLLYKATPDYMPAQQDVKTDAQYHKLAAYGQNAHQIILSRLPRTYSTSKTGHERMNFWVKNRHPVTLPIVKYAHTDLTLNGKPLNHPKTNSVRTLIVKPKIGKNVLQIHYQPSVQYEIGVIVSLLSWSALITTETWTRLKSLI